MRPQVRSARLQWPAPCSSAATRPPRLPLHPLRALASRLLGRIADRAAPASFPSVRAAAGVTAPVAMVVAGAGAPVALVIADPAASTEAVGVVAVGVAAA